MGLLQVLVEYVKQAFIEFSSESLMAPWIYLSFNKEFSSGNVGPGSFTQNLSESLNKSKLGMSVNSSKIGGY